MSTPKRPEPDRLKPPPKGWRAIHTIIALVLALIAAVSITVAVDENPDGTKHTTITLTSANNKRVVVTPSALAAAAGPKAERGLSGDGNAKTQASSDKANPSAPSVKGPIPLASPYQPGCLTRSNSVNYSYRNGTRPSLVVLHLTVSPNYSGWTDVNGVWAFLNRGSTQASANYIVDSEGHCIYAVSESLKSWNDANFNGATACGIEVINTGNESRYIGSPGLAQLARIVHDCAARWHIPLRLGAVSGATVTRSGVLDHYHLGGAGGGHSDIHNFGNSCLNQGPGANTYACDQIVINAAAHLGSTAKPISALSRKHCTELNTLRRRSLAYHAKYHVKGGHKLTKAEAKRAVYLRSYLKRNKLTCTVGAPHKAGKLVRG